MEVHGNITGLSASTIKSLERIYRRRVPFDRLTTPELTRSLTQFSHETGRQVGVLIDRSGNVDFVIVGDASKLWLPDLGRLRAAQGRFRGLRLVHTHLHDEAVTRDDLVDLTRLRLDMVAALCLSHDGYASNVYYAYCTPTDEYNASPVKQVGPIPYIHLDCNPSEILAELEAAFARAARLRPVQAKDGRSILVHVSSRQKSKAAPRSMAELRELARTAGLEVADAITQIRDHVDPKFVLGKGKLEDVVLRAMQLDADVLVFDHNLTPAQSAAIAAVTDLKVIDRTQLILDIFAQNAESRDGKLQVELAQMKYLLPRLGLRDDALSRLTGGIGGRGPGETKLEVGRRRARERIHYLENQLKQLEKQRGERRKRRKKLDVPIVAIVGYTNAGKSTLLNALTESDVIVENKLFATLDTRSRRLKFPEEREIVITDTVGFIRELPKDLFTAFRATFEETLDADLILEVVDASDSAFLEHLRTTEALLEELKLEGIARLLVYNKIDQVEDPHDIQKLCEASGAMMVTATHRETLRPLIDRMYHCLFTS